MNTLHIYAAQDIFKHASSDNVITYFTHTHTHIQLCAATIPNQGTGSLNTNSWNKTLVWKSTYIYICSMKGHLRDALLRFRAGVSLIKAHRFWFKPGADTLCPFCPHETEDELHVLCKCTMYNNIRPDFLRLGGLQDNVPYYSIRETTNQCHLQQTALFLIKAEKMRQITDWLIWNSRGI